jgi:heat-inducible transcriptional repressor
MLMQDLDPRKQRLLRAIVFEYVTSGEPVASDMLVQKYDLGVKSATVRNELAEMSELGYLEQPHTSAGRIPSDSGYRFYVDKLIVEKVIGENHQRALKDLTNLGWRQQRKTRILPFELLLFRQSVQPRPY